MHGLIPVENFISAICHILQQCSMTDSTEETVLVRPACCPPGQLLDANRALLHKACEDAAMLDEDAS